MKHRNWAGNVTFTAPTLARPTEIAQLQELVAGNSRVRALGTGHSFNRIADTPETLVTVADLPRSVVVTPSPQGDTAVAEASAGMTFHQLSQALQAEGWALPNMGSLPHISLAGAYATGTHGSGSALGCLASAVIGIELVRADGELVRVETGDPTFPGAVLSLGALGVATRVWIRVVPSFTLRQQVWTDVPLDALLADFDEVMATGYSVSLFSDWSDPRTVQSVWFKNRDGVDETVGGRWGGQAATTPQHPIRGIDPVATTEQLGVPGPWHERLPHFRPDFTPSAGDEQQTEYLLPRERAAEAIAAVAALGLGEVLQVSEIRTIAADRMWLSPFHGRDSVALHFTWRDDDALVGEAVARVERAIAAYEPRPHWGKVFHLPADDVRAQYADGLVRFRELAEAYDPERTFGNAFLETYVY